MSEKIKEINFLKQRSEEEILEHRQKIAELNTEYSKKIENCVFLNFYLIVNSYKEINALENKLSQLNAVFNEQKNVIKNIMNIIGLKAETINLVTSIKNGNSALYLIDLIQNLALGYNELNGRSVVHQSLLWETTVLYQVILTEDLVIFCTINESEELIYNKFYNLSDVIARCRTKDDANDLLIELQIKSLNTSYYFTANTDEETRGLFDSIKRTQLQAGKFIQKTDLDSLLSSVQHLPEMDMDLTLDYYDDVEEVNSASQVRVRTVRLYLLPTCLILAERQEDKFFFQKMTPRGLVEWPEIENDSNFFKIRMDDSVFCFLADSASKKERWKSLLDSENLEEKVERPAENRDFNDFCVLFEIAFVSHDFIQATKLILQAESLTTFLKSEDSKQYSKLRTKLTDQLTSELHSILDRPARVGFSDLCGLVSCLVDLEATYSTLRIFFMAKTREMKSVIRSVRMESDFKNFTSKLIESGYFFIITSFIQFKRAFYKEPKTLASGVVWLRDEFIVLVNVLFGHIFDDSKDIFTVVSCVDEMVTNSSAFLSYGFDILPDLHQTITKPMSDYLVNCSKIYIRSLESLNQDPGKFVSFSNAATCLKFTDKYINELPRLKSFIEGSSLKVSQSQWSVSQRNNRFIRAVLSLPVENCQNTVLQIITEILLSQMKILHKQLRACSANGMGHLVQADIEFAVECFLPAICSAHVDRYNLAECPAQLAKLSNYFKTPT